jgi:hypothetical protein
MESKAVVPTATVPTAAPAVVPAASAPVVAVPTAAAAPEPVAVPVSAPAPEHAEVEAVPAAAAGPAPTLRIATHAYDATDDDELTFVKGDIIMVHLPPTPLIQLPSLPIPKHTCPSLTGRWSPFPTLTTRTTAGFMAAPMAVLACFPQILLLHTPLSYA